MDSTPRLLSTTFAPVLHPVPKLARHDGKLNRKLNIPANQFRRMHMLLYKAKQHGFEAQLHWAKRPTVPALKAWIEGWLRYYAKVAPEKTAKLERLYLDAKNVARVGPVDPNAPS